MSPSEDAKRIARRHFRVGFVALAIFVMLGLVLESLHAFKSPMYLDVESEPRRLMWRLAHAHGTLLAMLHVIYALTIRAHAAAAKPFASACFMIALVLIPGGFFAGGIALHGADPNAAVALVPAGFVALIVALVSVARSFGETSRDDETKEDS